MPVPEHFLAQFGGTIAGGETWTCGIRMYSPGTPAQTITQTVQDDVATDVKNWFQASDNAIANVVQLRFVKFNKIGTDGRYKDKSKVWLTEYAAGAAVGGGTGVMLPAQLTICVTLDTGARGPQNRGRMYLPPMTTTTLWTDGQVSVATATQRANAMAVLINNLNNWPGIDWQLASGPAPVCSIVSEAGNHARKITSVRVGRIFDTQMRRRKNLQELYVPAVTTIA